MIRILGSQPYRTFTTIIIAIIGMKLLSKYLSYKIDFISARPISNPNDIIGNWKNDGWDFISIYRHSDKYGINENVLGFGDVVDLVHQNEGLYVLQFFGKESKCLVIIYTDESDRLFFYRQFYWSFSEIAEKLTPIIRLTTCEYITRGPFYRYKVSK
ncbi:hypothetical protein MKK84_33040 [Methylobacterium sp. E-065]|uniref:hypothetical protein n=1 Tax=Methylobacterium sp. E-065 TaxID=2836583 RepID=UPI001FBA6431|nr:hypothetical protein [Methylobacterium sp. E-065]MCJ2022176.1 hypothetical protein [Methylobacterium sp. E-065]